MVISAKWMSQPWPEFEPGLLIPFFFFFFTIMLPTQPLSHLPGNWVLVPALSNCRVLDWNQSNWGLNLFDNLGKKLLGKQWVTYFDMSEQMDRQTSAAKTKKSGNRKTGCCGEPESAPSWRNMRENLLDKSGQMDRGRSTTKTKGSLKSWSDLLSKLFPWHDYLVPGIWLCQEPAVLLSFYFIIWKTLT